MRGMFSQNKIFNQPIGTWDVGAVTSMNNIFYGASVFNQSLSNWNVDNVIWWINSFKDTSSFTQDLSAWGAVSGNCNSMFQGSAMNKNIGSWDISGVTSMEWMFAFSSFNQDLGWSVGSSVSISNIATSTACVETNCGVVQIGDPSQVRMASNAISPDLRMLSLQSQVR